MLLSIIIPVYNEPNLPKVLKTLKEVDWPEDVKTEVIVVDDYSTDGTREWLKENHYNEGVQLHLHPENHGKGTALRNGFLKARGDVIVIQDGDLELDPHDLKHMVIEMKNKNAQVVYGSRWLNKDTKRNGISYFIAGKMLTKFCNMLYGTKITDEPTCYKMFDANLLNSLDLKCKRFEFCPEVTAKVAKRKIPIYEIPISYVPRTKKEGKKIRWTDGIEAFWTLLKYRFKN